MEDFPRGRGAGSAGDDAPSFPRNNAGKVDKSLSLESKATPKRKRQPASADEGATAEVNATVKKPKTKTKSDISTNDEPSAIEPWRFKSLKPDSTHFLAIVREINDLELVVSLPNNLTGFVPITEISDIVSKAVEKATGAQAAESDKVASEVDSDSDDVSDLSSDVDGEVTLPSLEAMFRLGQIVRCVVTGIEDGSGKQSKGVAGEAAGDSKHRRRIEMSVSPGRTNSGVGPKALFEGLVLSASVTSREDHGYMLDLGIPKITCFLHDDHVPLSEDKGHGNSSNAAMELVQGQTILVQILTVDKGSRAVTCTARSTAIGRTVVPEATLGTMQLDQLRPGLLVNTKVKTVDESGLKLSFGGIFSGTVHYFHLPDHPHAAHKTVAERYKVDQKLRARILAVDLLNKTVTFTLRDSFVNWNPHASLLQARGPAATAVDGSIYRIGEILTNVTVVRADGMSGLFVVCGSAFGFVHISRIADSHLTKIPVNKFAVGTIHSGRILGFDACDELLQLSLQPSALEQPFVSHWDVHPGMLVSGELVRLLPAGAIVKLTDSITGLVPTAQLSDVRLQHPEKLFKPGQKLKLRVMSVNPQARKVLLTNRKSLVQDQLPVLGSYEEAAEGSIVQGTVTKMDSWGCIVSFYGDVRGILPVSELSTRYVEKTSDVVKLGQVVKCRIISCDAKERKLRLSLVLTGQSEPGQLESIAEAGRVAGRVISKTSDAVVLQLANSSAIASLPKHHLGQAPFQQGAIFDRLRDGAVLDDLLVLHADRARARLTVSANQVLKWADSRGLIPRTFEAIRENAVVVGFVKNLTDYGAFIGFLDDLVGYAKKQDIVAGYSGNPGSVLWLGRPVVARVTSIDHAARRFTLSLANVEIDPDLDRIYISACLEDQDVADLGKWSKGGNLAVEPRVRKALGLFPIGNVVKGAVKEVGKDTVKIELNNGLHGLLAVANAGNKPPAVGETMLCRAVAYDGEKQAVWVVLAEDTTVPRLKKIAVGASKRGTVRLVNGAMVVLELEELRGVLAFASILDLAPRASALRLSVGQVVTFDVVRLPTETGSEDISHAQLTAKRLVVKVSMQSGGTQQAGGGAELKRQIVDPVDPAMSTVDDFSIGKLTKGRIKSVKDSQLNVVLGSNLRGRVHVTEAFDSLDAVPNPKKPLAGFKSGQIVDVKVIGMVSSKNHKYLPITHQNPVSQTVVELTLRTSDLALPDGRLCDANRRPPSDLAHLAPGASLAGFIHEIRDSSLWVHLSSTVQGRIHALDASQDLDVIKELSSHFSLGQGVRCRVVRADHDRKLLDLSLLAPINLDEGSKLAGRIVSVDAVKGLVVQLPEQRYGKVALTDLADRFEEDPTKSFKVGETLIACVVGHDEARHQVDLSLRPSRLAHGGSKSEKPRDPEVMSLDDLSTGQDIRGYVVNVTDKGAFVALGRKVTARLKISEISTDFVKDWQSLVHTGQLLAGKIIGIDAAKGHVEISKKALDQTSSAGAKRLGWPDIEKGMKVDGTVTKVEPFGVFIRIDNSQGISGLCHISEVSNTPVKQLDKLYQPGDAVRAVILKIDLAKKRVSFGLKSTYFEEELADDEDEDEAMDDASEDGDSEEGSAESEADEMEEEGEGASHESDSEDDEDVAEGGSESADSEEEDDVVMVDAGNNEEDDDDEGEDAPLEVSAPFTWDPTAIDRESGPSDQDLSDEDEDEGDHGSDQKKSRRAKRKARKEKEQEVARREEELLDPNRSPETADDFERLILGSPSSSYIWVKYMAFHLQLGEIDRARDVAERALKTIHFREEAEKFNVWIAYLNLENAYGSQDKLDDVFQRACQYNDPKHMHLRMVAIYEQSGKDKLAEELYQSLVKKFKESSKVWVAFGLFYIKRGNIEESRKVLQRAIKSLAKRKHIKTIVKFAQMEFRLGEPERGRTIFESVVSTYPKRLDIWSIYLDMEKGSKARPGDPERVRRLFERMTSLQLSSKRARDLFKRWLEYEKEVGGSSEVDHVKQKAQAFVESLSAR